MPVVNLATAQAAAIQIRDETAIEANTATRVGGAMLNQAESVLYSGLAAALPERTIQRNQGGGGLGVLAGLVLRNPTIPGPPGDGQVNKDSPALTHHTEVYSTGNRYDSYIRTQLKSVGGSSIVQHYVISMGAILQSSATTPDTASLTDEYDFTATQADFKDNNLLTTGFLQIGATVAASGDIRGTSTLSIKSRTAGGTTYALVTAGSDGLVIGENTGCAFVTYRCASGGPHTWEIASTPKMQLASTGALYVGSNVALSESDGSINSVCSATSNERGVNVYQHSADTVAAAINGRKSRGTRSSLGAVVSSDVLLAMRAYGYAGATGGWAARAGVVFQVDGVVVDGATPTLPTSCTVRTGTTAETIRTTWASTGSQSHDTDPGGGYTWQINTANPMNYTGALYVGSTTAQSEQVGSIAAVSTGNAGRRGLLSWQHSADTVGPKAVFAKSRGTRASPGAVGSGDVQMEIASLAYLGATSQYVNRAAMFFTTDAAINDGAGSGPTAWQLWTGATAAALRVTVSSTGAQTSDTDSGGTYTRKINTANVEVLSSTSLDLSVVTFQWTSAIVGPTMTQAAASSGDGATLSVLGQPISSTGTNHGGDAVLAGGHATAASGALTGGVCSLQGGSCTNTTVGTSQTGGSVLIRGGGCSGTSGTRQGGHVDIRGGTGNGGTDGAVRIMKPDGSVRIQVNATGIGFFGATPVAQPSSTGETVGFTAGGGTTVTDASTFTGNVGATAYRISDLVKHMKNLGLVAS